MGRIEKTVFISYRRTDEPWALAIFGDLTQHGYDVFIDYDGLASGKFESAIFENIRARVHFLVLLTPTALAPRSDTVDWMRREIEAAIDNERNIVPLMLEGFEFGAPAIAVHLTGKLATLKQYNALSIPKGFFKPAMERLRDKFLNVSLDTVQHKASPDAQKVATEQKGKAAKALANEHNPERLQQVEQLREIRQTITWQQKTQYELIRADMVHVLRALTRFISSFGQQLAYISFSMPLVARRSLEMARAKITLKKLREYAWVLPIIVVFPWLSLYIIRNQIVHDEDWPFAPTTTLEFLDRADKKAEARNYSGAILDYTRVIRDYEKGGHQSDLISVLEKRAKSSMEHHDYRDAVNDFGRLISLSPSSSNWYGERAQAYLASNDYNKAIDDLTKAASLSPGPLSYIKRAQAYAQRADSYECPRNCDAALNSYGKALDDYDKAISIDPTVTSSIDAERYEAYKGRGKTYYSRAEARQCVPDCDLDMADYENALLDYDRAASLGQDDLSDLHERIVDALDGRAETYSSESYSKRDLNRAVNDFVKALRYNQDDVRAHIGLGDAYAALGKLSDAAQEYSSAIGLGNFISLADLGDKELNQAIGAFLGRGHVRYCLKQYPSAIEDLNKIIEFMPDDPDAAALYFRGLARQANGRRKEGSDDLEKASKIDGDVVKAGAKCGGNAKGPFPPLVRPRSGVQKSNKKL
jgi:tetratricopeptide (TPR) repeat protein